MRGGEPINDAVFDRITIAVQGEEEEEDEYAHMNGNHQWRRPSEEEEHVIPNLDCEVEILNRDRLETLHVVQGWIIAGIALNFCRTCHENYTACMQRLR